MEDILRHELAALVVVVTISQLAMPSSTLLAATPLTLPTPIQPSPSAVARACIPPGVDYKVDKWNFVSPYLLCFVSDAKSGTAKLLKRIPTGSFSFVSHGGGDITVTALKAYGVPPNVARSLESGLHK